MKRIGRNTGTLMLSEEGRKKHSHIVYLRGIDNMGITLIGVLDAVDITGRTRYI